MTISGFDSSTAVSLYCNYRRERDPREIATKETGDDGKRVFSLVRPDEVQRATAEGWSFDDAISELSLDLKKTGNYRITAADRLEALNVRIQELNPRLHNTIPRIEASQDHFELLMGENEELKKAVCALPVAGVSFPKGPMWPDAFTRNTKHGAVRGVDDVGQPFIALHVERVKGSSKYQSIEYLVFNEGKWKYISKDPDNRNYSLFYTDEVPDHTHMAEYYDLTQDQLIALTTLASYEPLTVNNAYGTETAQVMKTDEDLRYQFRDVKYAGKRK
jgi:hypothetical protein